MTCSGVNIATGKAVTVEFGEIIRSVEEVAELVAEAGEAEAYLAPGFVDLQVNGFAGVDFNDPRAPKAEISRAVDAILASGVTRFLPTVITGAPDDMLGALRNLRQAQKSLPRGAAIVGFHVEGPHIGDDDGPRGAHPRQWVRPPDLREFGGWQEATEGNIRLVTLSPHWPDSPGYIRALKEAGVAVSIGHTGATAAQLCAAVDAGATLSTHLGNAAYKLLPKHPNCLWDQLAEDRLSASFIVDGMHLDQAFLRVAVRTKQVERTILVTDAAAPAGAAPGAYRLGELNVELTPDDRVVLTGTQKLAGSALRMNRAIPNLARFGDLSLRDALRTATVNPAKLIGLEGRKLGLEPGEQGDIVLFRAGETLQIEAVFLAGERVA